MLYGKTQHHLKVRVSEHKGVSARKGRNIKSTKHSVVRDHTLVCSNIVSFEDFSVFANGTKVISTLKKFLWLVSMVFFLVYYSIYTFRQPENSLPRTTFNVF